MKLTDRLPAANHGRSDGNPPDIAVFGTTARWLAESARRAGWTPLAFDLFGDWDLHRAATARKLPSLESVRQHLIELKPGTPAVCGSGFESIAAHPDGLSQWPALCNAPADATRTVRHPPAWCQSLAAAGIRCPQFSMDGQNLQHGIARWLVKRLDGSGGIGVRNRDPQSPAAGEFLQEFVPGTPASLVGLGSCDQAILLGSFLQIVGDPAYGVRAGFQYCGSIGPISVPPAVSFQLQKIVDCLVFQCGLRGLFGVDFIIDGNGIDVVPVEINPRPTASCEILERTWQTSLLPPHVAAVEGTLEKTGLSPSIHRLPLTGKATLFWPGTKSLPVSADLHRWMVDRNREGELADLPHPGEEIASGRPLTTLFARGANPEETRQALHTAAADCLHQLESAAAAHGPIH